MAIVQNKGFFIMGTDGNIVDPTGILGEYQISDKDDDTTTKYYGFVKNDGSWYIMRETTSSGDQLYRYVAGSSGYTTAWTNRAAGGTVYDYFYTIF
jgi:hypothetical protein